MAGTAISLSAEPRRPTLTSAALIEILAQALHSRRSEWLFFRELRVGTGRSNSNLQRLDAFALNTLPHTAMRRVCYEVKVSRADFLCELKHPLKRRIGMRYSNEFYFATPAHLVAIEEIPPECGLVEAGYADPEEWRTLLPRHAGFFHYDEPTAPIASLPCPLPGAIPPAPPGNSPRRCCAISTAKWRAPRPPGPIQAKLDLLG